MPTPSRPRPQAVPNPPDELETPSVTPSPSDVEESSASSGRASRDELFEDAGPAFDPQHAPPAPDGAFPGEELGPEPGFPEEWSEQQVRQILEVQGQITHFALKTGPDDVDTWLHTAADLRAIAPPLTNILNRYDATRAAAAAGDEIALVAGVATYGSRNYMKRRRLLALQAAEGPRPVTGVPAPPDILEPDEEIGLEFEPRPDLTPKGYR